MSVIAMKVTTAEDVEGSKNLRVYTFEAPNQEPVTVVANRTNVYEVGDVAAVAKVGSILSAFDDLEITKRKVFGIESSGMAIGHVEEEPGTELGDDFSA